MSRTPLFALPLACLLTPFADAAATTEDQRLDTVTVISTGMRGNQRTVADSPAPIDVISNEQLLRTGRASCPRPFPNCCPRSTSAPTSPVSSLACGR